MDQESSNC
uniref:Uncharacterized protein n=1 Tax=Rhizophora mucronata TaxID=61149 RepID=A0A2P2QKD6_RHIMU